MAKASKSPVKIPAGADDEGHGPILGRLVAPLERLTVIAKAHRAIKAEGGFVMPPFDLHRETLAAALAACQAHALPWEMFDIAPWIARTLRGMEVPETDPPTRTPGAAALYWPPTPEALEALELALAVVKVAVEQGIEAEARPEPPEPGPRLSVTVKGESSTITLDGAPYPATAAQAAFVKVLLDRLDEWTTQAQMAGKSKVLAGVKPSKMGRDVRETLPKPILAAGIIEAQQGKGFRIARDNLMVKLD